MSKQLPSHFVSFDFDKGLKSVSSVAATPRSFHNPVCICLFMDYESFFSWHVEVTCSRWNRVNVFERNKSDYRRTKIKMLKWGQSESTRTGKQP